MTPRELLIDTFTHIPPRRALEQLTTDQAEQRTAGTSHSIAEIVAHMSFWQDWFCDRCDGVARQMVTSAAAGWPEVASGSWVELSARFSAGLERAVALAQRGEAAITPAIEFGPLAHYTVRDAIVHIAQHNSHHLGQVIVMRQLMGLWPPPGGSWTW